LSTISRGSSGLPVAWAGHTEVQRPHMVQASVSSNCFHVKSSTTLAPKLSRLVSVRFGIAFMAPFGRSLSFRYMFSGEVNMWRSIVTGRRPRNTRPTASEGDPSARRRRATRVRLQVIDTGAGMDAATKDRVFDPFFTTKFAGRGLGLATVLRIVQAHNGVIDVTSDLGVGTTFDVEFPSFESAATLGEPAGQGMAGSWVGSGTALLADDEVLVRSVVRDMLMGLGFDVVEASDGVEAMEVFRSRASEFALVVLDVTMPAMGGREAAAAMRALRPEVPVVCISGYEDGGPPDADLSPAVAFLHKPFRAAMLAAKVREAMSDA